MTKVMSELICDNAALHAVAWYRCMSMSGDVIVS